MAIPEGEAVLIHLAGHLHDIGKIGVPDAILKKHGRLSPEEWNWVRKHPEIGARVIAAADTISALLQYRPHRPGTDLERATAEIRRCAASQFDPAAVEALAATGNRLPRLLALGRAA